MEILYCDKCGNMIPPGGLEEGKYFLVGGEPVCPKCYKEMPPEAHTGETLKGEQKVEARRPTDALVPTKQKRPSSRMIAPARRRPPSTTLIPAARRSSGASSGRLPAQGSQGSKLVIAGLVAVILFVLLAAWAVLGGRGDDGRRVSPPPPQPPVTFSLSVEKEGEGTGNVHAEPAGPYGAPTVVTLRVAANEDSEFSHWRDGRGTEDNPRKLMIDGNKTVIAVFRKKAAGSKQTYKVLVRTEGAPGGRVILDPPGGEYPAGTRVTLLAEPPPGYVFKQWTGIMLKKGNPGTLTVDRRRRLAAVFERGKTAPPPPGAQAIFPEADTWIENGKFREHSNSKSIHVAGNNTKEGLLRFDISRLAGKRITSARVKLTLSSRGRGSQEVEFRAEPADSDWDEKRVNWDTKPKSYAKIAGWPGATNSPEFDVTDLIRQALEDGKRKFSIKLRCLHEAEEARAVSYSSSEAPEEERPRLVVKLAEEAPKTSGGPVAHFPLEGYEANRTPDTANPAGGGTVYGKPEVVKGPRGSALHFRGQLDRIAVADRPEMRATDALTVAAWMKTDESQRSRALMAKSQGEYGKPYEYLLYLVNKSGVAFWVKADDDKRYDAAAGFSYADGKWHHLAGVFDRGKMLLYVDGREVGARNVPARKIKSSGLPVHLAYGYGGLFKGALDDARIYTRALPPEEIRKLAEPAAAEASDLVLHWTMDEIRDKRIPDASGRGNDGGYSYKLIPVAGPVGGALELNGRNACISSGGSGRQVKGLSGNNPPHTVAAWVKPDALPTERSWIMLLGPEKPGSHHWLLRSDGTTQLGVWGLEKGQTVSKQQFRPKLVAGKWQHLAVTFDGKTLRAYVNGEAAGSTEAKFDLGNRAKLTVGRGLNDENWFDGAVDDVRLYARALSAEEVRTLAGVEPIASGDFKVEILAYRGPDPKRRGEIKPAGDPQCFRVGSKVLLSGQAWAKIPPPLDGAWRLVVPWQGREARRTDTYRLRVSGPCTVYAILQEKHPLGISWMGDSWKPTGLVCESEKGNRYRVVSKEMPAAGEITLGDDTVQHKAMNFAFVPRSVAGRPPAAAGPAAHWTLDSLAGGKAADATGNGHDGVVVGGPKEIADGRVAGAVEFDEKDDDVAVPDFDYAPKGKFTAAFWFRARDNSGSGCQYMLSHGRVGAHHNLNVYFMEDGYVRSQGVLRTSLADEDDKEGEGPEALGQLDVPRGLADGKWHHYSLVVDAGGSRVYIDGEKRAESKNGGGAFNPDGKLFIGCRQNRARARFYGGDLDDVRVYSRALSANEVRDLARAKAAPVPVPVPAPAKLKINIEKYNGKAVARRPKVIPAGAPDSFRKGVVASTGVRDPWTWDEVPPQLAGCARILGPWQGKKAEREDTYVVRVNGPCAVYALLCEEGGGKRRKWMDQSWQSTSLRARGNGVAWRAWKKRMTAAGTVTVGDDNVTYRTVFLVFAPIGPKPEPPAGGGPVARWTLDILAGNTVVDATIGGHDGVAGGGPKTVAGVIAGAAQFDEKDDRIEIHDFDYAPKGEFTAAFWFRVRKVRGYSYEYMFSHGGFQKPNSVHVHFCEWGVAGKGGVLRTRLNDASNPSAGDSAVLDVKRGLDDDKWHHYALAVGRFGSRVYVDGEKKVESRNGGGPFNPPGKLVIGARTDLDKDRFYGGALDDVRIYSRALSADEVRGLAKSAPASPAGPASGAFIEKDGLVVMEAEHSTGQEAGEGNTAASKWIEDKAQKGFAGECAVAVLPDKGVAALETGAGPRLDYAVKFSKTGTYYAWIRMLGPNGFSDSLHAGFDGKPLAPKTPTIAAGGRWNWESLPGGTKLDMKVDKPGKHTFNIWMHEDGVYVDRIILTTDPDFKPEREGPAESAREGGGQSLRPSPPGSPAEAGSVYLCDLKPARVLKRKQDTVEFDKRVEAHGKTYEKCIVMKPAQYGTTVVGYELDGKYSLLLTGKAYLGTGAQGSFSFVVLDGATQLFKSHASSENSKIDVRGVKKLFIRSHTTRALPADARAVWLSPRLIPVEPRK